MISCDTNILLPACDRDSVYHEKARGFLGHVSSRDDFCLAEQVLMELYCLLRNPTVCERPLSAPLAVGIIQRFRSNPRWRIVDVVPGAPIMEQTWSSAASHHFPYGRLFDARLAYTLRHHGVKEFATRNGRDFIDSGFTRVWDPLT